MRAEPIAHVHGPDEAAEQAADDGCTAVTDVGNYSLENGSVGSFEEARVGNEDRLRGIGREEAESCRGFCDELESLLVPGHVTTT